MSFENVTIKSKPSDCFIVGNNLDSIARQLNELRENQIIFNQMSPVQFLEGKYIIHIVKLVPVENENETN